MLLSPRLRTRWWLLGVLFCTAGVLLVRFVAPSLPESPGGICRSVGHLLAIAGLFVIAYGISRRLRETNPNDDSSN